MGRIIEKRLRLRRRSSNDIIYPKTLASLVMTRDGKTVEEALAEGGSGSGGSTGGGGLYTLPIVVNLDQGKYSKTGEIDMAALRSCSKVSMGLTSAELPEGVVYEIEWGFNCRTRQYYEGYVDQEEFLFGQYEVNGTMKDLNLQFSNGQLTMLKTGDTSFTDADGGGSDPAVI